MEDNARLRRVEVKIDEMQQAIVALAKVEVRIETIFARQTSIETQPTPSYSKLVASGIQEDHKMKIQGDVLDSHTGLPH